ncbi:hypothetical protein SKAU_G00001080 [Synaphobranchus kaupii]|uniref:Peptidase S54 rhomboid domain-containing protein n=1 Tax=Synaphobranchus kaupii TaxID=118154 RepID=A0A9Q1G948_SYNKA|nr:hypothetical protein SKAU_G00001080 [Synaphobranchus kaupii]
MHGIISSEWFWVGSKRPGFPLGTTFLLTLIVSVWLGGIQSNLCLGPDGLFPGIQVHRLALHAISHEELFPLVYSAALLLWLGQCQERWMGTLTFLALSLLSMALPPLLYVLVLSLGGGQTGRICGYSAAHLTMFTAQCGHLKQRRLLRWVPVWSLPWLLLLVSTVLMSDTSILLHVCAVCVGHCYSPAVIGRLQQAEKLAVWGVLPARAFISSSSRDWLPTSITTQRHAPFLQSLSVGQSASSHRPDWEDSHPVPPQPWPSPVSDWLMEGAATTSQVQLLDEELLRAGILASLQDTSEGPGDKVEVPKSSVSSLRLQQLEKMGFPTEKAVVALAATGKLDGAISLLIDDRVGAEAVVTSKGKSQS